MNNFFLEAQFFLFLILLVNFFFKDFLLAEFLNSSFLIISEFLCSSNSNSSTKSKLSFFLISSNLNSLAFDFEYNFPDLVIEFSI